MSQRNVDDDLDWDYARSKFQELGKVKAKLKQYEPVIEAAKKWRTDLAFDEMTSENAYVLYAAIMDLEAAEKEER